MKPRFFANAERFRAWLEQHGARETELLVGFYKVGSGKPSISWPESVDEALCFGWIDGVRKRLDDEAYTIRFTPRRPHSIWSAVNVARVAELTSQQRMRPAGSEAFARRIERRTGVYAYEQQGVSQLTPAERRSFRSNAAAWEFFEQVAPSYRRVMIHWVISAKRAETRARRLAQLIEASASGTRLRK